MWDLSFSTEDGTCAPCIASVESFNHWDRSSGKSQWPTFFFKSLRPLKSGRFPRFCHMSIWSPAPWQCGRCPSVCVSSPSGVYSGGLGPLWLAALIALAGRQDKEGVTAPDWVCSLLRHQLEGPLPTSGPETAAGPRVRLAAFRHVCDDAQLVKDFILIRQWEGE